MLFFDSALGVFVGAIHMCFLVEVVQAMKELYRKTQGKGHGAQSFSCVFLFNLCIA